MLNKIKQLVANKCVLLLGFGKEGKSTYRVLEQLGGYAQLDIADNLLSTIDIAESHNLLSGDSYMDTLDNYDIVFKSPGIVLPKNREEYNCVITSQIELFLQSYAKQTIGVTGTKGKSTVTTLIYHTLKQNGIDCLLAGNIGIPAFDIIDKISPTTVIALELSCHQLEYCAYSPSVAVLLNLFEDHLDHYETFENYSNAKFNIYAHQNKEDTLFCNPDNIPSTVDCISHIVPVATSCLPFSEIETVENIKLRGTHNLLNCAFVYSVCRLFSVKENGFLNALSTYQPLSHRLEFIGRISDVDYYDDSISTTVESAISAVKSINNAKILLLGGMDRGIDYSSLVDFLLQSDLNHIIMMYKSGERIFGLLSNKIADYPYAPNLILVKDLAEAVNMAKVHANCDDACILSPASASYGDFKNFEERGDIFKKIVFSN